jgi:DNA-binding LacI/PurR family transcriptional regulator
MEQVAKHAGVSLKTVSRVVNNEENVSEETREKVNQTIAELAYVPNLAARRLSSGKAMTIGFILGWPLTSTYSSSLAHFIQFECTNNGYNLVLFSMSDNIRDQVMQACLGKQVDGFILDTNSAQDVSLRELLNNSKIPFVIVHPASMDGMDNISYVTIDDYESAKTAVEYLIELGHSVIGCLVSGIARIQNDERLNGYQDALKNAGIPVLDSLIYRDEPSGFSLGYSGTLQLISMHDNLSAVFCANDEIAMGAMSAIWQSGRKIPDDISVIGFDDIKYASMLIPPLTTVRQPIDQIASVAVDQLIEIISDSGADLCGTVLPTVLIVRKTCKAFQ